MGQELCEYGGILMKPEDPGFVPRSALRDMLPSDHPGNEEQELTLVQQFALPVLLWFLDNRRNRATGRSYLLARAYIELAMRGEEIHLEDISVPSNMRRPGTPSYLVDIVMRIAKQAYPKHVFDYNHSRNVLIYKGRRPR